jgi:hypothetical protein
VLAFAASIAASGSRGGVLGAFVGMLAVALLAPASLRARAALALLVIGGLGVSAWAMTIPKPTPAPSIASPATGTPAPVRNAEAILPLSQEIGHPWWTHRSVSSQRRLLDTSVRVRALRGTIARALDRPLLGYGFGAEQWAFVNRYYNFASENSENGYVGLLLQLGVLGLALFVVIGALFIVPGIRACLRRRGSDAGVLAAVGATAAGLGLALSQSFFHAPGNIGYVAFWVAASLAGVSLVARERVR